MYSWPGCGEDNLLTLEEITEEALRSGAEESDPEMLSTYSSIRLTHMAKFSSLYFAFTKNKEKSSWSWSPVKEKYFK